MDFKLIEDAKNGNRYALSLLLQQNYDFVYKFFVKLTLSPDEAADLTQDVMVQTINKFNSYDPEKSSLSTWMIAIGKNLWIDGLRKQKRRGGYHLNIDEQIDLRVQEDPFQKLLLTDDILMALKKLSEKIRTPIVLKYSLGYSYEEIAKYLKIPIGTVKSRISSGMKTLREELGDHEEQTS